MPTREITSLRELSALLGEGAEFDGKLLFEGRVRIDGKFKGRISSEDVLIIGERGEVEATVEVGTLIVLGGTLRGDVRATKAVELHAPAKVYGNITTPQLAIDRGVVFEGQSRVPDEAAPLLEPGPEPSSQAQPDDEPGTEPAGTGERE